MLDKLLTSWKTSAAGAGLILGALADLATALGQGHASSNLEADVAAIITGVGLLAAKDSNVTGGTKPQ